MKIIIFLFYDEEETMTLNADKIIYATGQVINWGDLLNGSNVKIR